MLVADFGLQLGSLVLDLALEVDDGEVVALLGPNGAGKTTSLRALAGLQPVDRGHISLGGVALDDPATGTLVAPDQRRIGVVFQDYLLFGHLTVLDNVAFGPRAVGMSKAASRDEARRWLDRVGMGALADARPPTLSGGEAQRVALARALAAGPQLLLLDEPLAALDAQTRMRVRGEVRRHLASFAGAGVLVTHDPVDAIVLADRLVILEAGRIVQAGSATEVTARPRSRYVADLVGINLLDGTASGERSARLASGFELTLAEQLGDADVAIAVRPQAVVLARAEPGGSPRNRWRATVASIHPDRDRVRVALEGPVPVTAEITPGALAELALRPGDEVWATVKAVDLDAYPR